MSKRFIVVGDKTSHGGVVLTGSPYSDIDGKSISRLGDKISCPKKSCPREGTIAQIDDPNMIIDGQPVAREGNKTSCGATLIASQSLTNSDLGGGDEVNTGAIASGASMISSLADRDEDCSAQFSMQSESGKPLANIAYVMESEEGHYFEGFTDQDGKTERLYTKTPVKFTVRKNTKLNDIDVATPPASERFDVAA